VVSKIFFSGQQNKCTGRSTDIKVFTWNRKAGEWIYIMWSKAGQKRL